MNLHIPNEITIRNNQVIIDQRNGTPNIPVLSELNRFNGTSTVLFTQPSSKQAVSIDFSLDGLVVQLDLSKKALNHLLDLLEPYRDAEEVVDYNNNKVKQPDVIL